MAKVPQSDLPSNLVPASDMPDFRPPPEPGLEPVGLLESFIAPVKAYGMAVPAIKAAEKFGGPIVSRIAGEMMPKTGLQLVGQAATAGTAGVAGELASRQVPEPYKPYARMGAELATGVAAGMTPKIGRGPTPAIPEERIEAARYLESVGGRPSPGQISKGPFAEPTARRLTAQQGVANQEYNRAVGLVKPGDTVPKQFGKKEFDSAMRQASADYDRLLTGRKVTFDPKFFTNLEDVLKREQSLAGTGITFGQSRALIGALERIGTIPKNLQAKIDRLPRIGEAEATAKQSQDALSILNELVPAIRNNPKIQMDAKDYNDIRSILGDAAARAESNRTARLLRKVQGSFDEVADRSMPDIVRDLEGVRRRYEALKTLEEAQLKSGVEMGLIPPNAVGQAIRARIEQGAIYGNNNPLRQIGEAGVSLNIGPPGMGRTFGQDLERGLTPRSTGYALLRDIFTLPAYPFKKYAAARRISEPPSPAAAVTPTGAALVTQPERK